MKRNYGCGSFILVLIVTILVILIGGYFIFQSYISPYLNNADVQELYQIYTDLSEPVNESDFVSNIPDTADYNSAKNSLIAGGIAIFDESGEIDPALIEESNFYPTNDITLTDQELASMINAFIGNPLNLEKIGITEENIGGLNTQVLEVVIEKQNETTVKLSFVVKLDMTNIKMQLGFFGFFIPDTLYVENENILQLTEGGYSLIDGSVTVNNLDETKNERILEILTQVLKNNDEAMTKEKLEESIGQLILSGIQGLSDTFHTTISFEQNAITFHPNTI